MSHYILPFVSTFLPPFAPPPLRGLSRMRYPLRYYGGSDSCARYFFNPGHRSPFFTHSTTARIPSPSTPIRLYISFSALSRQLPFRVYSAFQASPYPCRLAPYESRIEFSILRTARSPSVASHPASRRRSFGWLQGRRALPWQGL